MPDNTYRTYQRQLKLYRKVTTPTLAIGKIIVEQRGEGIWPIRTREVERLTALFHDLRSGKMGSDALEYSLSTSSLAVVLRDQLLGLLVVRPSSIGVSKRRR
ncbi:hypothetical protein HDU88_005646 [Geranomyces variabilis]|nr:hypothetical protein HDU88_005646 [Geranomyces variabilis]